MKNIEIETEDLLEFDLDEEISGFEINAADISSAVETDFIKIRRYPRPAPAQVRYERALDLVANLPDLQENDAIFCLVSGNFIAGDLIEALLVERNWYAEELFVATLSMSKENVDSLYNLLHGDYVGHLGLVVSDFWYAHERRATGGVPYFMDTMQGFDFSFAAAGIHTKIVLIRTKCGQHLVLHGSANLRSSRNVEQIVIERSQSLFDFNRRWMRHILTEFNLSLKSLRGDNLWQALPEQAKKEK